MQKASHQLPATWAIGNLDNLIHPTCYNTLCEKENLLQFSPLVASLILRGNPVL